MPQTTQTGMLHIPSGEIIIKINTAEPVAVVRKGAIVDSQGAV